MYGRLNPSPSRQSNVCGTLIDNRIEGGNTSVWLSTGLLELRSKVEFCKMIYYDKC